MYGTVVKHSKMLKRQEHVPMSRKGTLPPATLAAINDVESGRTETVSLDELKAQMDAIS